MQKDTIYLFTKQHLETLLLSLTQFMTCTVFAISTGSKSHTCVVILCLQLVSFYAGCGAYITRCKTCRALSLVDTFKGTEGRPDTWLQLKLALTFYWTE